MERSMQGLDSILPGVNISFMLCLSCPHNFKKLYAALAGPAIGSEAVIMLTVGTNCRLQHEQALIGWAGRCSQHPTVSG